MAKLLSLTTISRVTGEKVLWAYFFICPGCDDSHQVHVAHVDDAQGAIWGFNGDVNAPTFTPSLLVRSGHFVPMDHPHETCWCTYRKRYDVALAIREGRSHEPPTCYICHSFITNGFIQFLPDCTHKLAGQTVLLPNIDLKNHPWVT